MSCAPAISIKSFIIAASSLGLAEAGPCESLWRHGAGRAGARVIASAGAHRLRSRRRSADGPPLRVDRQTRVPPFEKTFVADIVPGFRPGCPQRLAGFWARDALRLMAVEGVPSLSGLTKPLRRARWPGLLGSPPQERDDGGLRGKAERARRRGEERRAKLKPKRSWGEAALKLSAQAPSAHGSIGLRLHPCRSPIAAAPSFFPPARRCPEGADEGPSAFPFRSFEEREGT